MTDISDDEKESMIAEMQLPMVCPNTTQFIIEGTQIFETTYFEILLSLKEDADLSILENTIIMSSYQSRYFNAEYYNEHGF